MLTIVVGFDGSDASLMAIDWAAERACRGPAHVHIVMVGGKLFSDDYRIDISLLTAENRLRTKSPDTEITTQRLTGRMPEPLLEHALDHGDLLVIGSHRGRPIRSALTGWLPLRIAARSQIPVVVVPDNWSPRSGPVVVGIDDDDSSDAALIWAAAYAERTTSVLHLIHAWQLPDPEREGSIALLASPIAAKAEHREHLRHAAHDVSTRLQTTPEPILMQTSPSAALLEEGKDAALIVLGTHHRGFGAGAFLGSVGQDVLAQASTPVCIVPSAL